MRKLILISLFLLSLCSICHAAYFTQTAVYPTSNAVVFIVSPNASAQFKVINGATGALPIITSGNVQVVNGVNANPLFVSPNKTAVFVVTPHATSQFKVSGNVKATNYGTKEAITGIEYVHMKCHEGAMYVLNLVTENVADNGTINVVIVPSKSISAQVHIRFEAEAIGNCQVYLYENTSYNAGVAYTLRNMNRNYPDSATTIVYSPVTLVSDGTLLGYNYILGGSGNPASTKFGGEARTEGEWILNNNYAYLGRIVNKSGAATTIKVVIAGYRE